MKKLRVIFVLFFALLMVSGCSCTSSMCTQEDMENIKAGIKEKVDTEEYRTTLREEAIKKDITDETLITQYIEDSITKEVDSQYSSHPKACITIVDLEDPESGATIGKKTWGEAFKEGLLEGLIVFPISWLLISFTNLFGGNGIGQILAIILTTIIIRSLMLLLTFKSQVQTQKLQVVQVEISEISNKLKDPNITPAEKNRLSMKIMEIYKKNNINPLSSLIPTIVSLPIFLSVWSAVSQTLLIRTGDFLGMNLGTAVSTQVFSFNITAIILFILMTASQIFSMKMPMIIRNKQANYKNKEQVKAANKQMSMMTNIMLIMILITGFLLPSALAIYWTVGAVFSIVQTIVFQNPKVKEKLSRIGDRKKKAKVVQ